MTRKTLSLAILTLTLTACANGGAFDATPNYTMAQQEARSASPEDVKFCEYEADKYATPSNNRNFMVAGIETTERRAAIFRSCLRSRQ